MAGCQGRLMIGMRTAANLSKGLPHSQRIAHICWEHQARECAPKLWSAFTALLLIAGHIR